MTSTSNSISECPVCDSNIPNKTELNAQMEYLIECERCGKYKIRRVLFEDRPIPWRGVGHFVSAWIRRQNKAKIIPTLGEGVEQSSLNSQEWWFNQYSHMGFPETTSEKINKLLVAYAESIKGDYDGQITLNQPYFIAEIAAKNQNEVKGLTRLLKEMEFFDLNVSRITAKGWLHIQELDKNNFESNLAFIAMWFDDSTKLYRDSVIVAINYCGYDPVIVDQKEYNGFIMDQVVSLIKQSRFLVADFTTLPETEKGGKVKNGVRGGVYWEAGMAYGLGRQVIHTCKDHEESKRRIHFDVNQYNTIYWKEDELSTKVRPHDQPNSSPNFPEKLVVRILSTIGRGNNPPAK